MAPIMELLKKDPWLVVVVLGMSIPIISVVVGSITSYLTRVRQAELEAGLKHDMLQRGMSAEDIRMVIEASAPRPGKTCKPDSAVRHEIS